MPVAACVALALSACAAHEPPRAADTIVHRGTPVEVVRTATCECCSQHAPYLADAGFDVRDTVVNRERLTALRDEIGITAEARSCHMSFMTRPAPDDSDVPARG